MTGPLVSIWNGTGLPSPEAPHTYKKDGWHYLLTAESGTRERHRANMARSRNLYGPYEGAPTNPLLSGSLSQSYFQAVGHADIFPDPQGNFCAITSGVRAGYSYNFDPYNSIFPMGRGGLLTPVDWPAEELSTFKNVTGTMSGGFTLPQPSGEQTLPSQGEGYSSSGDDSINYEPGSTLHPYLFHWRLPVSKNDAISPAGDGNLIGRTRSCYALRCSTCRLLTPTQREDVGRHSSRANKRIRTSNTA